MIFHVADVDAFHRHAVGQGLKPDFVARDVERRLSPFLALAHSEIRCQSGFCLFFPRDASIDAVHAQAPPRELCHDLRSRIRLSVQWELLRVQRLARYLRVG